MIIGGLQRVSLSDFPGRIAAIVFTQGCNFRCRYCHNPELVDPARYGDVIPQEAVLRHAHERRTLLQGVVVTGGEPTQQDDLPDFLAAVHELGLATKLDTNGSHPDRLRTLLEAGLVDYVAMDIKAPPGSYERVAGVSVDPGAIERSLDLVMNYGIAYEVRSTYSREFLSHVDLREMAFAIRGCRSFTLQAFCPTKALDSAVLGYRSPRSEEMEEARSIFESQGIPVTVRRRDATGRRMR